MSHIRIVAHDYIEVSVDGREVGAYAIVADTAHELDLMVKMITACIEAHGVEPDVSAEIEEQP